MLQGIRKRKYALMGSLMGALIALSAIWLHADAHDADVAQVESDEAESTAAEESDVPSVAAGLALSAPCTACHGADGNTLIPEYSNIAGQNEKYLYKQLKLIQSNERPIPLMVGQLDAMTDKNLRDLSAYYASLPGKIGQASEENLELGEAIYRGGILEKKVAACTACHAPNGNGNLLAGFPRLSGQPVEYTIAQLKAYREQERTTDEYVSGMMRDIAAKMTDTEIAAVANYITGLY